MATIKEHCCGADMLFDKKRAYKQYSRYVKKGPTKVSKRLIGQLEKVEQGVSLMDVGGGIGAIQWWFLEAGGKQTYSIDASSGYLEIAQQHATKHNFDMNAHFVMGDFTAKAEELPTVDHITLDKVICCYPDYIAILDLACQKSRHSISLSYPMDGFVADVFRGFMVLLMQLNKNPFKPFVHRVASVRALIEANGFELKERELSFPWHVETYVKN